MKSTEVPLVDRSRTTTSPTELGDFNRSVSKGRQFVLRPKLSLLSLMLLIALAALSVSYITNMRKRLPRTPSDDLGRLLGKWQSDKEKTLANLHQETAERLEGFFGKMTIRYTNETAVVDYEGTETTYRYTILGSNSRVMILQLAAPDGYGEPLLAKLVFDGPDSYWVSDETVGVRECFRKLRKYEW